MTGAPHIAELEWLEVSPGHFTAKATSGWWDLWKAGREALKAVGLGCGSSATGWEVSFKSGADKAAIDAAVMTVRERLQTRWAQQSEGAADRRAAEQKRQTDAEAQRAARKAAIEADRLVRQARAQKHAADVKAVQAAADACLKEWGLFPDDKAVMRALADEPDLNAKQIKKLRKLVDAVAVKATQRGADLEGRDGSDAVLWPDTSVALAIDLLTSADADHSKLANGVGWSRADTSTGHWLYAMLKRDRDQAIRLGRGIVGPYLKNQLRVMSPHFQTPEFDA